MWNPEIPHLYRVPKWRWWGVRLINGRKVRHADGWFMRWMISEEWYYREALPHELPTD